MVKNNKIIKDLKERNDKLVNQYRDRDIRCVSLERQLEKLQQENLDLRIQVSAREEVANKYKEAIDKAVEYIEKHLTDNGRFLMLNEWQVPDLLRILKEVE